MNHKRLFQLLAALPLAPILAAQPLEFEQTLQGVHFSAYSTNDASINNLTLTVTLTSTRDPQALSLSENDSGDIAPRGHTNTVMLRESLETDGTISAVELADLDANGFPEIYIYTHSAGSGSYGAVLAYASNRNLSMTPIYLPPLTDDPHLATGYMGHDEFTVGERALLRRFPVYKQGDSNAEPTGGMRQIDYQLRPGEAGWLLAPVNHLDSP